MTVKDTNQPHVYLGGRRLEETRGHSGVAVIEGLAITWGAEGWGDDIEPSRLDLTLLDPIGTLAQSLAVVDTEVEVRRDDESLIWRGRITDTQATRVTQQLAHGGKRAAWRVTVIALDPLEQLARDRRRGDQSGYPGWHGIHWDNGMLEDRRAAIEARTPLSILWPSTPSAYEPYGGIIAGYNLNQTVSLLTVLRNTARLYGLLQRPFYRPQTDRIEHIEPKPAAAARVGMIYHTTTTRKARAGVYSTAASGSHPRLSATDLATDAHEVDTTLQDQVTTVEMVTRTTTVSQDTDGLEVYEMTDISRTKSAVTGTSQQTQRLEMDLDESYGPPDDGDGWNAQNDRAPQFYGQIYNRARIGPVRLRQRVNEPPVNAALMLPAPPVYGDGLPVPYLLEGAVANNLAGVGPVAFTAGTLRYLPGKGWVHDLQPAPINVEPPPTSTPMTLANLTYLPPAMDLDDDETSYRLLTLADVEDRITVGDFQKLTTLELKNV